MQPNDETFRRALDAMKAGGWPELSGQEWEAFAQYVEEMPEVAGELGAIRAGERRQDGAHGDAWLAGIPDVQCPDDQAWDGCWRAVEMSLTSGDKAPSVKDEAVGRAGSRRYRLWTWGSGLAGVAAIAALAVGLWPDGRDGASALRLAHGREAEIESMEVFDDSTAFVLAGGEDEDVAIIWVAEENS